MSKNINTKVPNPNNPSSLKPRYEIRKLEHQHLNWATAVMCHTNGFYSPVWPIIYPDMGGRAVEFYETCGYLVQHQIDSGLSFGVFDTEYEYKTEEAKRAGGKLYWASKDPNNVFSEQGAEAEGERLLEQMDFPLVSIALSYDGAKPLDMTKMGPLMELLPHFGLAYGILGAMDPRDPKSWQPTEPGQVLMRNSTSTRKDYEGQGIMAGLARWLMREAAQRGYRGIQIESMSDAVHHVWSKSEPPFKGNVISEFSMATWTDEEGKLAFAPSKQRASKIYVDLKPEAQQTVKETQM